MALPIETIELFTSKEFLATIGSGIVALAGIVVKVNKEISKRIEAREQLSKQQMEEQSLRTAAIIAGVMHSEIESSLDNHRHVRNTQISIAEDRLTEYATAVTVTAPDMAKSLVCDMSCGNVEEIAEMWGFSVMMAITHTGLGVMVKVINRNGFLRMSSEEFDDLIDNLSGIPRRDGKLRDKDYDLFKAFAKSMYSYFHKEKIKVRIAHIEKTLDRMFLRQTVSNIMYECLNLSKEYHDSKSQRSTDLSDRIKRDIIAGKVD